MDSPHWGLQRQMDGKRTGRRQIVADCSVREGTVVSCLENLTQNWLSHDRFIPTYSKLFLEAPVLTYVTFEANWSFRAPPQQHRGTQPPGYMVHQTVSYISLFPTQTAGNFPHFLALLSSSAHAPSKHITDISLSTALKVLFLHLRLFSPSLYMLMLNYTKTVFLQSPTLKAQEYWFLITVDQNCCFSQC